MIHDEYYLVVRSNSQFIRIWNVKTLKESFPLDNKNEVTSMTFDSYYIITCDVKNEIR